MSSHVDRGPRYRFELPRCHQLLSHHMFTNTRCAATGQTGVRTFFIIKLTQNQAREITRYSLLPGEDEVLLPPGCQFRVTSVLPQGDLTIIQVEELPSTAWILDLHVAAAAAAPEPGGGAAQPEPAAADAEVERLRAEVERMRVERDAERRAREEAEARREREARDAAMAREMHEAELRRQVRRAACELDTGGTGGQIGLRAAGAADTAARAAAGRA